MAEINELLELANEETGALASDAARLRQVLSRLTASSVSMEESLEQGVGETQRLIATLSVRLDEAEEELGREAATATGRLAGVEGSARETLAAGQLLGSRVREDLGALRGEREQLGDELMKQGETARSSTSRYAKHTRDADAQAEERLRQVEGSLALLRQQAEQNRGAVSERREVLLAEARAFEARLRGDMQHVLRLYDALAADIERQLRELQASAQSLSEQVGTRLERKLSRDATESLEQAAGLLRDALSALERFSERGRDRASGRLSEVTVAVEDVARTLDRMQPALDQVKQYLR
ncbi:MAG TPA: hypothetical protein VJU18_04370 [Vicinamibacteria bacterium]|nr:hypothetical protein [Vicinamibacteria bacterium]